jgi:hypothetical protein
LFTGPIAKAESKGRYPGYYKEHNKKITVNEVHDLRYKKGASQGRYKTAWDTPFLRL